MQWPPNLMILYFAFYLNYYVQSEHSTLNNNIICWNFKLIMYFLHTLYVKMNCIYTIYIYKVDLFRNYLQCSKMNEYIYKN